MIEKDNYYRMDDMFGQMMESLRRSAEDTSETAKAKSFLPYAGIGLDTIAGLSDAVISSSMAMIPEFKGGDIEYKGSFPREMIRDLSEKANPNLMDDIIAMQKRVDGHIAEKLNK
jgi:hypothetical protein